MRLTTRVDRRGGHDHVTVWADGQNIGCLTVGVGAEQALVDRLTSPLRSVTLVDGTARAINPAHIVTASLVTYRGEAEIVCTMTAGPALRLAATAANGEAAAQLRRCAPAIQPEQNPHRCSDGNCVLLAPGAPVGMHTNGGCLCLRDPKGHDAVRVRAGISWLAARVRPHREEDPC